MARILTASDRSALIRLAFSLPKGSEERRAILAGLSKTALEGYEGLDAQFDQKKAIRLFDAFANKVSPRIKTMSMVTGDILKTSSREVIGMIVVRSPVITGINPEASHVVWLTVEPWTNGVRYTVAVRAIEPGTNGRVRRWENSSKVYEADEVLGFLADRTIREINADLADLLS